MPTLKYPFTAGFSPDLDPRTPGILADTQQVYPTPAGFRPFRQLARASDNPVLNNPQGSYFTEYVDDPHTNAIFAGTLQRLYRYDANLIPGNGVWTDISGGQNFSLTATDQRWRYATFGNDVIAVNGVDLPQKIVQNGNAAPIVGAPIGTLVETVGNFVLIFSGSTWNCSGIGNDADWTPDLATQAANALIGDMPGPFTGAKALTQNSLLLYKNRGMYLGTYVGPPIIWDFQRLSDVAGSLSQESIVNYNGIQFTIGSSEFYRCDGGPPQKLDCPLRKWFFEESWKPAKGYPIGIWDKFHDIIMWFYHTGTDPGVVPVVDTSRYIAFHPSSGRWTTGSYANRIMDVVQPFVHVQATGAVVMTHTEGTDQGEFYGPALFLQDRHLHGFSGDYAPGYVVTGDQGDAKMFSMLTAVRPYMKVFPAGLDPSVGTQQPAANPLLCTTLWRYSLGATQSASPEAQANLYGEFGVRQSARWHAIKITMLVDAEILGLEADFASEGMR